MNAPHEISPDDELVTMTVDEVAEGLKTSKRKAYQLILNREIESIKVGPKCRRITRAAYKRFIANRTEAALYQ